MKSPGPRPTAGDEAALVSVVINNYNYARFLGDAIDSSLAQTYKPLEIIVVDDGSTDDSRRVIASYGNLIRPVFKENGGQASAFNAGFLAAGGEIVIFLDSDDILLPGAAEQSAQLFEPGVVKVHWPLWEIDTAGNRTGEKHPQRALGEGDLRERTMVEGPLAGNSPPTSGNAWSRNFLKRVLPAPETEFRICTDGYLVTLAWVYGEVRAIQEPLGLYRVHGENRFAARTPEQRMARHLEKFVHHCSALESHLRAMGESPRPGVWKRWKGIYDSQVDEAAKAQLSALLHAPVRVILVDDNAWADLPPEAFGGGVALTPFLERDGKYWGRPANDTVAIAELERLRAAGCNLMVFPWFSFWWLDYYTEFAKYLYDKFMCDWTEFFAVVDLGWEERRAALAKDLVEVLPAGAHYLLVDEGSWSGKDHKGVVLTADHHPRPFLEREGEYWGRPADDGSAITEVELARDAGAEFIVFPWFTFWWLDYYEEFSSHLRQSFRCILANDLLVVFDMRSLMPPARDPQTT